MSLRALIFRYSSSATFFRPILSNKAFKPMSPFIQRGKADIVSRSSQNQQLTRPLLAREAFKPMPYNFRRDKADLSPHTPWLEKPSLLFSPTGIRRNPEVLPIMILVIVGVTCEFLWTVRNALTRDDVRYSKHSKMACEKVEMRKNKPAPIRKFRVYNQKYETPQGLIDALKEPSEEDKDDKKAKKK